MKVSQLNENELTVELIDQIIYEGIEGTPTTAACIMVLGSQKAAQYRVPKAAALYHRQLADKILMCGGKRIPSRYGMEHEANLMAQAAVKQNVPMRDIILEQQSMTTKENMICASLALERTFRLCNVKKILLVTTNYHMRRSLAMAAAYMPQWIEFIPCCAPYPKTERDVWDQQEDSRALVAGEAKKIISYIREGSIPDFEIERSRPCATKKR